MLNLKILIITLSFVISSKSIAKQLNFSMMDGSISQNIAFCVVKKAYEKVGHKFKEERIKAANTLELVNMNRYDGEVSRIKYGEYENVIRLKIPTHYMKAVAFVNRLDSFEPKSFSDLKSKVIAVNTNALFSKLDPREYKRIYQLNSYENALRMVSIDRAQVAIVNYSNGIMLAKKAGINNLRAGKYTLKVIPMYHYLHKDHRELAKSVEETLLKMQESGEINEIHNGYMKKVENFDYSNFSIEEFPQIPCP